MKIEIEYDKKKKKRNCDKHFKKFLQQLKINSKYENQSKVDKC